MKIKFPFEVQPAWKFNVISGGLFTIPWIFFILLAIYEGEKNLSLYLGLILFALLGSSIFTIGMVNKRMGSPLIFTNKGIHIRRKFWKEKEFIDWEDIEVIEEVSLGRGGGLAILVKKLEKYFSERDIEEYKIKLQTQSKEHIQTMRMLWGGQGNLQIEIPFQLLAIRRKKLLAICQELLNTYNADRANLQE